MPLRMTRVWEEEEKNGHHQETGEKNTDRNQDPELRETS